MNLKIKTPYFFIYGCGRSGTTLLSALLSANPDIYVVNDSFVFNVFSNNYPFNKKSDGLKKSGKILKNISFLNHHLKAVKRIFYYRRSPQSYIRKNIQVQGDLKIENKVKVQEYLTCLKLRYKRSLQNKNPWLYKYKDTVKIQNILDRINKGDPWSKVFNIVLSGLVPADQQKKHILGEKTPVHLYNYKWINELYPESRTIFLVRNPFSNIAAIYKRMNLDLKASVNQYKSYYLPHFKKVFEQSSTKVVRYEDLIKSPEIILKDIYRFLNIDAGVIKTSFPSYVKKHNIGEKIDPQRDIDLIKLLNLKQKQYIYSNCTAVFDKFYPDIFEHYNSLLDPEEYAKFRNE